MPRWVPHSAHACTHAWQPMQRLWSMTKIGLSSMPYRAVFMRQVRDTRHVHGGDLELRHLRQRVDRSDRQLVGGLRRPASGTG